MKECDILRGQNILCPSTPQLPRIYAPAYINASRGLAATAEFIVNYSDTVALGYLVWTSVGCRYAHVCGFRFRRPTANLTSRVILLGGRHPMMASTSFAQWSTRIF